MLRGLIILPFTGGALLFDVPWVMPDRITLRLAKLRSSGSTGLVFVYRDGKVARRTVTVGPSAGGQRHVLTGVSEGERVVLSPPESLKDGDAVKAADSG